MGSPYPMRAPCGRCGATDGVLERVGRQDTVRCAACRTFAYNAPRAETGEPSETVRSRPDLAPSVRSAVLERCGFRCWECGRRAPDVALHVAHLVSVADAVANGWTVEQAHHTLNLIAACEECNQGRGARSFAPQSAIWYALAVLRLGIKWGME